MWELPIFALIATLGGLLGAGFVGVSKRLALFRARHLAGARRRFAEASYFEEACYIWRELENGPSGDRQWLHGINHTTLPAPMLPGPAPFSLGPHEERARLQLLKLHGLTITSNTSEPFCSS